ncbi:MAG: hypothetical protein JWO20_1455 [Candidatus Angelobacter sp.]|jgi:hypothetical protein|nr:hypothetical protein [Candidatus Angelobacter sp.]
MINFEAAIKALTEAAVEFVVVGAYAAVAQGSSQLTRDLDICYKRSPENLKRLATALDPYHPRLRGAPASVPFFLDQRTLSQGMNFTLETDLGDIDLMGDLSGVGQFPEVARDAVIVPLHGVSCQVASLDVVIRSKRAAGRPKDLAALPELEALKELRVALKKDKRDDR